MPEYAQLQTYATCSPETFQEVVERYETVLASLGCTDQNVFAWLADLRWPSSDDDSFGDIYALPFVFAQDKSMQLSCDSLTVSLYVESAVPSVEDRPAWVGFDLLFETEHVYQEHSTVYMPGFGGKIWPVMRRLAEAFPEIGVYLADDYQDNRAWRALAENAGADPWAFDLGIFPRALAEHFSEVSPGFQGTVLDKNFGFALQNRWSTLPWQEAEPA